MFFSASKFEEQLKKIAPAKAGAKMLSRKKATKQFVAYKVITEKFFPEAGCFSP